MREGDRIMVVKNDYELGIFNGDVGKVSRIDHKKQIVRIKSMPMEMLLQAL